MISFFPESAHPISAGVASSSTFDRYLRELTYDSVAPLSRTQEFLSNVDCGCLFRFLRGVPLIMNTWWLGLPFRAVGVRIFCRCIAVVTSFNCRCWRCIRSLILSSSRALFFSNMAFDGLC